MKRIRKENTGSALLLAMVIVSVTLVLGLALLAVSFSLHATLSRQQSLMQSRELAQTISRQLEQEITVAPAPGTEENYKLWKYLRDNISVKNNDTLWPYLDTEKRGHKTEDAYRYFKLDGTNVGVASRSAAARKLLENTSILVYWESDNTELAVDDDDVLTNDAVLTVVVTCGVGKEKTSITSHYVLRIDPGTKAWQWGKDG